MPEWSLLEWVLTGITGGVIAMGFGLMVAMIKRIRQVSRDFDPDVSKEVRERNMRRKP